MLLTLVVAASCSSSKNEIPPKIDRIAFGSCLQLDLPVPIWGAINKAKPDLWIWLGDNIYGDTDDTEALKGAYAKVKRIDVRYHRDSPDDPNGDIFGAAQREWIAQEFENSAAAVTIVASGTQVVPEEHAYEMWAQFPEARQWFFEQVAKSNSGPVVFLSGDRRIAEISIEQPEGHSRPLYNITSSSLTHSWKDFPGEPNRHRVGEVFTGENFGLLEFDWKKSLVRATIRDVSEKVALEQVIPF